MTPSALVVVDVINDFLPPTGSMAVPGGKEIIPVIKGLLDRYKWDWQSVIVAQDYHPKGHISFASTHGKAPLTDQLVTDAHGVEYVQSLWPEHAVQGTKGTELNKDLQESYEHWKDRAKRVRKGVHTKLEAYSAFEGYVSDDWDPQEPPQTDGSELPKDVLPADGELAKYLRSKGIEKVVIVGLATEYCVLQTSLSSLSAAFPTLLVAPGMRGMTDKACDKAFEKIESLDGVVIGRDGGDWEAELKAWIA